MKTILINLIFTAPYSSIVLLLLFYVFAFIANKKSDTPHDKRFIPYYGIRGQRKVNVFDIVSMLFLFLGILTIVFLIYYQIAFSKM